MRVFFFTAVAFFSLLSSLHAFTTTGFQVPYGVTVDTKTGMIYVSNINGSVDARDDNGFISRLKTDGSVDQMRFIDGASRDVAMNAPKGMAIVGNTLYVTDIDKLHAFDLATGKFLFDVNFGDLPVGHFYDVAALPDSVLVVADAGSNIIYRVNVAKLHEVTTVAAGDFLGAPHGVAWFPAKQLVLATNTAIGSVTALDLSGKRQPTAALSIKGIERIAMDNAGYVYVTSPPMNAIFRLLPNFATKSFGLGLRAPMGVAYHPGFNGIIFTLPEAQAVQSMPMPAQAQLPAN